MKRAIAAFILAAIAGYVGMWLHHRQQRAAFNEGYCAAAKAAGVDAGCP